MDEKTYAVRVKRLREVDKVIKSLDPAIREASFNILKNYITGGKAEPSQAGLEGLDLSKEKFFSKFDHDKPADNVLMIAAYHYSQYGTQPVSYQEIREIANEVGITVPGRIDKTLKQSRRKGKNLFTDAGKGKMKPTVNGEIFLKDTYDVTKGKKQKESAES